MCFTVDMDDIRSEGFATIPELMFLMDYNPGRMVSAVDETTTNKAPKSMKEMKDNHENPNEAMIYIETLGRLP